MHLSLRAAARETGLNKSTISRAIASGRLSATRHDDGRITVEPSELFRVFPPRTEAHRGDIDEMRHDASPPASPVAELQARVRMLEEQLAEARQDRDRWHQAATDALRRPLMLAPPDAPAPRRGWWPFRRSA